MGDPAFSSDGFRRFFYRVRNQGLEWLGLYYGHYRAEVIDNENITGKDGTRDKEGLLKVRVPAIGDTANTAPRIAYPMASLAGPDYGYKSLPPKGGFVWVVFEGGRADMPIWTGGWWGTGELPPEFVKTKRHGFKTPGGHSILFSDEKDNEFVRITWHKPGSGDGEFAFIELGKDGSVSMSNKKGASFFLNAGGESVLLVSQQGHSISMTDKALTLADKDGNVISIDGGAVTVLSNGDVNVRGKNVNIGAGSVFLGDPATFKAVLGELLLIWLATHVHGTGVGPSSPPIVPPPPTILSNSIKVKA
jgi:hypothetical protein